MLATKQRRLRELGVALGALIVALLTVVAIVSVHIDLLEAADRADSEAREELALCDAVSDATGDQASALDGLLATQNTRFIAPFDEGRARLEPALAKLAGVRGGRPDRPTGQRRGDRRPVAPVDGHVRGTSDRRCPIRPIPDSRRWRRQAQQRMPSAIADLHGDEVRALQASDRAQAGAYASSRLALILGSVAALGFTTLILGRTARQLIGERRLAEENAEQLKQALDGRRRRNGPRLVPHQHEPRGAHAAEWRLRHRRRCSPRLPRSTDQRELVGRHPVFVGRWIG